MSSLYPAFCTISLAQSGIRNKYFVTFVRDNIYLTFSERGRLILQNRLMNCL